MITPVLICIVTLLLSSLFTVHAAGAKVKDLEDEAARLLEKLQPIKKLQDNLKRNISQIKELINQARKQANSVRCLQSCMWHDVTQTYLRTGLIFFSFNYWFIIIYKHDTDTS